MPNCPHIANPRAPIAIFGFVLKLASVFGILNTFSTDFELRNDCNDPFDRQVLDMRDKQCINRGMHKS